MTDSKSQNIIRKQGQDEISGLIFALKVMITDYNQELVRRQSSPYLSMEEVASWYGLKPTSASAIRRHLQREGRPFEMVGGKPRVRQVDSPKPTSLEESQWNTPKFEAIKVRH
jgi:hypothetical protein